MDISLKKSETDRFIDNEESIASASLVEPNEEQIQEPAPKLKAIKRREYTDISNSSKLQKRKNIRRVKGRENLVDESKAAQQQEVERLRAIHSRLQPVSPKSSEAHISPSAKTTKKAECDSSVQSLSSGNEELPHHSSTTSQLNSLESENSLNGGGLQSDQAESFGFHTDDHLNLCDEQGRVLVNVSHPPEEPEVFLAPQLSRAAQPHQIGGVRFLFDNIIQNLRKPLTTDGFGCVLAHSMGLGKTFQICAFVDVFFKCTAARTVLIVAPVSILSNWAAEFNRWLPSDDLVQSRSFDIYVFDESSRDPNSRSMVVANWTHQGGVLIIGYEIFRNIFNDWEDIRKQSANETTLDDENKNKSLTEMYRAIINPGPDLIILDEGHRLKKEKSSTSKALNTVGTRRRIVLTGYPLQNNLLEYWVMINFVRPNYLGTMTEFGNDFQRPILNGQCIDSNPRDVKLMKERVHVLHQLLKGFVQRRTEQVLRGVLPPKEEHVLLLRMSALQRQLYKEQMLQLSLDESVPNPLEALAIGTKIWNHPDILFALQLKKKTEVIEKTASDVIVVPVTAQAGVSGQTSSILSTSHAGTTGCEQPQAQVSKGGALQIFKDYVPGDFRAAAKTTVFFSILEQTVMVGDRLLVFSQSIQTLDLLESFLSTRQIPNREERWAKNRFYFRFDGTTAGMERDRLVKEFNSNEEILLFLISTRAGGTGINLTGANRVVIFDSSWNPCEDAQAVCRVYRFGQKKPCFVYRLVTDNSLEKKIFDRQMGKRVVADRVIDDRDLQSYLTKKDAAPLRTVSIHEEEDPPIRDYANSDFQASDEVLSAVIQNCGYWLTKDPSLLSSLFVEEDDSLKLKKDEKESAQAKFKESKCVDSPISPAKTRQHLPVNPKPKTTSSKTKTTQQRILHSMKKMR